MRAITYTIVTVVFWIASGPVETSADEARIAGTASGKPNILFILSDDHATAAVGAYGSRINQTPQIDRLANEGMRFAHVFCTNSICTPSCASIPTGLYGHVSGAKTNYTITEQSSAWLEQRETSRPFMLVVQHSAPHAPFVPANKYKDLYGKPEQHALVNQLKNQLHDLQTRLNDHSQTNK